MVDKPVLYIIHNTEYGIKCEIVRRDNFHKWISERTENIKPEHWPKFISRFPDENTGINEYLIFVGDIIVPKPAVYVESYTLEGA